MGREIFGPQRISRFLCSSSDFSKDKGVVKKRAFWPGKDREVSAFFSDGLSDAQILKVAHGVLTDKRKLNPKVNYYGRADFLASAVLAATSIAPTGTAVRLEIVVDDERFLGHTSIKGWPADESLWDWIAITIAACSRLELV